MLVGLPNALTDLDTSLASITQPRQRFPFPFQAGHDSQCNPCISNDPSGGLCSWQRIPGMSVSCAALRTRICGLGCVTCYLRHSGRACYSVQCARTVHFCQLPLQSVSPQSIWQFYRHYARGSPAPAPSTLASRKYPVHTARHS